MIPLPTRQCSLWGTPYDVTPYLLEFVHGDGKQWFWIGYMDDRPNFYVARVDSGVSLDGPEQWHKCVMPRLEDAILAEALNLASDADYEEYCETGFIADREWPMPPLECPCGTNWGHYTPTTEDQIDAALREDREPPQ